MPSKENWTIADRSTQEVFLEALERRRNVKVACRDTGVAVRTLNAYRKEDGDFDAEVRVVLDSIDAELESRALEVAIDGTKDVRNVGGTPVDIVKIYPGLMQFLLERRMPEKYGYIPPESRLKNNDTESELEFE